MVLVLQFLGGLVLGFLLPGYALARWLGADNRWCWAFPLSMVLLFWAVFAAGICGLPVTGPIVGGLLIVETLAIFLLSGKGAPRDLPSAGDAPRTRAARPIVWGLFILVAVVLFRTTLWPLSGYDTSFRWDFLARRMLLEHGFSFYPPIGAADYRIYFYTDGIPPLVSFSYAWLYTAAGGWHPSLTSILVAAQLALTLWFIYSIGRKTHSPLAGLLAAGILGGSTLYIRSVAIGQETGLTALSVAAMFDAVAGRRDGRAMVLAGVAAALGALSREYGCVIPVLGAVAVVWLGAGLKKALILATTTAILAGPWYLRNWLVAGNPFYSNHFLSFHVNAMHVAILDYYRTFIGVSTWNLRQWLVVGLSLLEQAPLQCTLGLFAIVMFFRRSGFLALTAATFGLLWLDSVGYTSGIWLYSMRVLTPALVALSIPAGRFIATARRSRPWMIATFASVAWSILAASVHPFFVTEPHLLRHWTDVVRSTTRPEARWWTALPRVLRPGARVLCANPYIHAGLTSSGIDFVPVWSPEVAFIADPSISPNTVRQRLLDRGIRYAVVENDPNGHFLAEYVPFYHADMRFWTVIASAGNDASVFEIPAPNH
ncbi:MAG TPA: hypothetical protein VL992_11625 [Tepidisphaeraceae bacterium]|nr:hypothetical protein [Tepidisphaeraceae bacterium]